MLAARPASPRLGCRTRLWSVRPRPGQAPTSTSASRWADNGASRKHCSRTTTLLPFAPVLLCASSSLARSLGSVSLCASSARMCPSVVRYDPPLVRSILPFHGNDRGGETIIINGLNFGHVAIAGVEVKLGKTPCAETAWLADNKLSCVTPPAETGLVGTPRSMCHCLVATVAEVACPCPQARLVSALPCPPPHAHLSPTSYCPPRHAP